MWVENWYKVLKAFNDNTGKSNATANITYYNGTSGATSIVYNLSSSQYYIMQLSDTGSSITASIAKLSNGTNVFRLNYTDNNTTTGVILGDGDTPPTLTDYCLSGNMITDFTATTAITSAINNGKLEIIATYNITNTGGSAFTIKEIANTFAPYSNRIMLSRELLATPLTIEPGNTGVLTYKIEIT